LSVFKSELNWSTYQDEQLKALRSIGKTLTITETGLNNSFSKIESILTFIGKASEVNAKNIASMTKEWTGTYAELNTSFRDIIRTNENFRNSLDNAGRGLDDLERKTKIAGDSLVSSITTITKRLLSRIGGLDGIGRETDNYSAISNSMIKISSLDGDAVREFRSNITSIVSDLNRATGYLYNTKEAYSTIVSVSQNVTNSTEALQEMAKPLLLSSETLDININTVAQTFNKFYTRYMFSSKNMEDTLDSIRGNTAGNAADTEKIMANMNILEGWINRYAGSDNELREQLLKEVSQYSAWLDSMNVDSTWFTQALKDIAGGNWSERTDLIAILNKAGYTDMTEVTDIVRSGGLGKITEAIFNGINEFEGYLDSYASLYATKGVGLDQDQLLNITNLKSSGGYISLEDFIVNSYKNATTMEDAAEEKYVSAADKTNHYLSKIYDTLAKIQEHIGIGFSDIALAAALTKGVLWGNGGSLVGGVGNIVGAARSKLAGNMLAGNMLTNIYTPQLAPLSAGLSKVAALGGGLGGAAMLAGGVAGGTALGFDGIKGMMDNEKSAGYRVASGAEAALGIGGTAALLSPALGLGLTNPIGWIALVTGGITFFAKNAIENATELSGNAKDVERQIGDIGDSLKKENAQRLSDISELRYQFTQETDIEKQRQLLEESGLFNKEDLQNKEEEQLLALIDSYKNSVSALDEVTEGALKLADKFYSDQQNEQQKDFIKDLKSTDLTESQMTDIISLLQTSVTDDDLLEKFSKALEDKNITKDEFNDLLYGGKNSWFDKNNLEDKSLDVAGMQRVAGYLGWDKSYVTADNMEEVVKLYNKFADPTNSEEDRKAAWEAIVNSGLEDEVRNIYGNQLKVYGYSEGSNYITKDQLAMIHEGEAVVPKKYNPAANTEGFKEIVKELSEIREFLREWKEYNARKEQMNSLRSAHKFNRNLINQYLSY
jgi:Asp-tRNA(Asn)/Glu-tRNA(Gln) amidotransferase C subunit